LDRRLGEFQSDLDRETREKSFCLCRDLKPAIQSVAREGDIAVNKIKTKHILWYSRLRRMLEKRW
jgi:hypothetical protein